MFFPTLAIGDRGGRGQDVEVDVDVDGGASGEVAGVFDLESSERLRDLDVLARRLVGSTTESAHGRRGEDSRGQEAGDGESWEEHDDDWNRDWKR